MRRAPPLQPTADARAAAWPACRASSPPSAASSTAPGCASRQGERAVVLPARVDPSLAANVVRVAAGHPRTAALGPMFGRLEIALEPVAQDAGAVVAGAV